MGADDKIENKAEELKGKVKQGVGDATDNDRMVAEGQAEEADGKFKQAGEKVKDAVQDVKDVFKR
ncbi:CsbD family protein [Sphaerisporangium corydalis]|uniref:CsbD family protein n=1 Tax=Sphaerisporangium corydalis TaxID=1441875 RepID=A0ABV9ESC1_9ACTN|nr:CsbD family protein [Sphaerisporangium corydalis]